MEQKFCQSCGMPLNTKELYGTESDGSLNSEYCIYCYSKGEFTFNGTLAEMIDICTPHVLASHPEMNEAEARNMMQQFLPNLKRWRSPEIKAELEQKGIKLLEQCPTVSLASISENGYPRPCILVKIASHGLRKIYVSTGTTSRKTVQFRLNPKAGLSFGQGADGVTLTGTVRILDDLKERAPYWQDWMLPHFPKGAEDPEFCVLEFNTEEVVYWINNIFETVHF